MLNWRLSDCRRPDLDLNFRWAPTCGTRIVPCIVQVRQGSTQSWGGFRRDPREILLCWQNERIKQAAVHVLIAHHIHANKLPGMQEERIMQKHYVDVTSSLRYENNCQCDIPKCYFFTGWDRYGTRPLRCMNMILGWFTSGFLVLGRSFFAVWMLRDPPTGLALDPAAKSCSWFDSQLVGCRFPQGLKAQQHQ